MAGALGRSPRRRAQAGTTLIELLVAVFISGLALALLVGTFSTGLLDATLAKRNTAVQAVVQYELGSIGASEFNAGAQPYSECFATEAPTAPTVLPSYQSSCPGSQFTLRADMAWTAGPDSSVQVWTVTVVTWPAGGQVGQSVSIYKVNR